jgi:hypothetical protein
MSKKENKTERQKPKKIHHLAIVGFILAVFGFIPFVVLDANYLLVVFSVPTGLIGFISDFLFKLSLSFDVIHPYFIAAITPSLFVGAVICGHLAWKQINRSSSLLTGKKLILAGLILAYVCLPLSIFSKLLGSQISAHFFSSFEDFDRTKQPWQEYAIELPDGSGRIIFMRRHTHPFLAEYDRKIRFETKTLQGVIKPLRRNTGGKTKINVYYYERKNGEGPYLKLQDQYGHYRFDLGRGGKEILYFPSSLPKKYIGRFDGTQHPLRFISPDESKEQRIKMIQEKEL